MSTGLVVISASLMPSVSSSYASALLPISGNINIRRIKERTLYNELITGQALRSQVGQNAQTYVDPASQNTFSLVGSYSNQPATPPSWTQLNIRQAHGFVIPALSSSQAEVSRLNAFFSGNFALETSAVPASGAAFFSKQNRFVRKVYYLTASLALSNQLAATNEQNPSNIECVSGRSNYDPVSGTYINNSYYNPTVLEIDVPDYGRIRDVRVWLEFIHDIRGGTQTLSGTQTSAGTATFFQGGVGTQNSGSYTKHGLQNVQVSLRSPNVSFKYAHPLWNDVQTQGFLNRPDSNIVSQYQGVPSLLQDSYLLWAGHAVDDCLGISLGTTTSSLPNSLFTGTIIDSLGVVTGSQLAGLNSIVDHAGLVHVFYGMATGSSQGQNPNVMTLRRAVWNGSTAFVSSTIDATAGVTMVAGASAVDQTGVVHVSYESIATAATTSSLNYAKLSGSAITLQVVDYLTGSIIYSSIQPDNNNNPNIAYIAQVRDALGNNAAVLKYASSGSSGWSTEVLDPSLGSGLASSPGPSLQIDSGNVPHVCYFSSGSSIGALAGLFYATQTGSNWSSELIDQTATTVYSPVLVLDTGSIPRVTYYDVTNSVVKYATRVSRGVWNVSQIIFSGNINWKNDFNLNGINLSMVLDSGSNPHVTYWNSGLNALNYSRLTNNGWATTPLVTSGTAAPGAFSNNVSQLSSISIDHVGNRHIFMSDVSVFFTNLLTTVNSPRLWWYFASITGSVPQQDYIEFDTDIDMRTIFWDGSTNPNPRRNGQLFQSPSQNSPGQADLTINKVYSGHYPSPLSGAITNFGFSRFIPVADQDCWMTGANFPWMLDPRIPPGNFTGRNFSATSSLGSSPPVGWLSGPAGTANVNEWPTTGTQVGPTSITPVYPLLDDVYVQKIVDQPAVVASAFSIPSIHPIYKGFRPGLRGTEINGRWFLLIGVGSDYAGNSMTGNARAGVWFRQARLEFTIDQNRGLDSFYPSKARRFSKPGYVPVPEGQRLISILSGSSEWDIGVNYVYVDQSPEYGRTIGITDQTGSFTHGFAVFSQITGAFADMLTGSNEDVLDTFLANQWGRPYIPLSSGSGIFPSFDPYDPVTALNHQAAIASVLTLHPLVQTANTINATLNRLNYFQTTRDRIMTAAAAAEGILPLTASFHLSSPVTFKKSPL
jgi:hypothetical protein